MMLWMALGLIVGILGILHVVFVREGYSPDIINHDALKRLANDLGIEFTLDKTQDEDSTNIVGRLHGIVEDFEISAREESIDSAEHVPFRCIYEIHTSGHSLSDKLLLYREGPPTKVGKILGGEDIEVGDATIDQAFVIRDITPSSAKALFARPDVVDAFMHLTTLTPRIIFENHKLSIMHTGTRLNAEQARRSINALVRCALLLCETGNNRAHDSKPRATKDSFDALGVAPSTWQTTTP